MDTVSESPNQARQSWRQAIIEKCIANGITNPNLYMTANEAECYVFRNELIVPYTDDEQKQALINAIREVIPNFEEWWRIDPKRAVLAK